MIDIKLEADTIDVSECISLVSSASCGGINVFVGTVRNYTKGKKVVALHFEAYELMAEKELNKIAAAAMELWPVENIIIRHRVGELTIGDVPVVIAVAAAHRAAAFDTCRYVIDMLKKTVPIWKKEIFEDGEVWVAAHP